MEEIQRSHYAPKCRCEGIFFLERSLSKDDREKISDFYDTEIETTLSGLTALIEPLLIAFLGVVIGGIVLAMFMPIFKLHELVSQ